MRADKGDKGRAKKGIDRIRNDQVVQAKLVIAAALVLGGYEAVTGGMELIAITALTPAAVAGVVAGSGLILIGLGVGVAGLTYGIITLNEVFGGGRRHHRLLAGSARRRRRRLLRRLVVRAGSIA